MSWDPHAVMKRQMEMQKPPVSNVQRQRKFRKRNPGYYGKRKRRKQAEMEAQLAAEAVAVAAVVVPVETPAVVVAPSVQLCLPAPQPTVTIEMLLNGQWQAEPVTVAASPASPRTGSSM